MTGPVPIFHAHASAADLDAAVAAALVRAIADARGAPGLILLSGGSTPAPVYRALAAQVRDWSGVTLGLVDERWVAPDDAGSNARLLRDTLPLERPGGPRFWPLVQFAQGPQASLAQARAQYRCALAAGPLRMVVFGMGDDGHTASLFPGSPDLESALASVEPYALLDASGCPGAQSWPLRLSLTPAGWHPAQRRILLMRGARKRQVLEAALARGAAAALPVRAAIQCGAAPLEVHWSP